MTRSRRFIVMAGGALLLAYGLLCAPGVARAQEPEPTLRLTVAVTNGEWALVKAEQLKMVIPLTDKERVLAEGEMPTGLALDLLGADKASLVKVGIEDPTLTVAEYEDPEAPGRIVRQTVRQPEMTFSVLLPAPAGARYLSLSQPAEGQWAVAAASQEREELGLFVLPLE